jgi:hypothetical protein
MRLFAKIPGISLIDGYVQTESQTPILIYSGHLRDTYSPTKEIIRGSAPSAKFLHEQ